MTFSLLLDDSSLSFSLSNSVMSFFHIDFSLALFLFIRFVVLCRSFVINL